MPTTRTTNGTAGAGRAAPRGVDPGVWALAEALRTARERLPYATAEARLLDGLQRWLALEAKAVGPARLAAAGPRWAAALRAVAAVAALVSDEARALLAPWAGPAGFGVGAGAPGVSPHAAQAAAFETFRPPYESACLPDEDVCLTHDEPLVEPGRCATGVARG